MGKAIMDTVTIEQPQTTKSPKTPGTRLLDLLAGWTNYVSSDEEHDCTDTMMQAEDIGALYQEAANLVMPLDDVTAEEIAVRQFLQERILPLLLRKN